MKEVCQEVTSAEECLWVAFSTLWALIFACGGNTDVVVVEHSKPS